MRNYLLCLSLHLTQFLALQRILSLVLFVCRGGRWCIWLDTRKAPCRFEWIATYRVGKMQSTFSKGKAIYEYCCKKWGTEPSTNCSKRWRWTTNVKIYGWKEKKSKIKKKIGKYLFALKWLLLKPDNQHYFRWFPLQIKYYSSYLFNVLWNKSRH